MAGKKPTIHEALAMLRQVSPEHGDVIGRHLYQDNMTPLGNKFSYQDHLSRNKDVGTHALVDLNDFKQINKKWGNEIGDQAISRFGEIASKVSRLHGLKGHRIGGDEFSFWHKDPNKVKSFAHELKRQLTKEPKIGGSHNLAASVGIGQGKDQAEKALIHAKGKLGTQDPKTGLRQAHYTPGNAPTVIHSMDAAPEENKAEVNPQTLANPLSKSQMAIISDTNSIYPSTGESLRDTLDNLQIPYLELQENFGGVKNSLLIGPLEETLAKGLAEDAGQESYVYLSKSDEAKLIYVNGVNVGKCHTSKGVNLLLSKPQDNYFYLKKSEDYFDFWFSHGLEDYKSNQEDQN